MTTPPAVELVITPPSQAGAPLAERFQSRMTLGVLTQLLAEAEQRVLISAPFLQQGYGLSAGPLAIATQAALQRGVNVTIVSTRQSLEYIDPYWLRQNSRGKLQLFSPSANLSAEQKLGSHAKFCVADGRIAYVGSANLTGPGLSENLEIGLLVRGIVAEQIEALWRYSLEIGLFQVIDY
jgi:phosphatidylserine/phosphatidylglycerophosphate/cardiolipin synthase-like enzyme